MLSEWVKLMARRLRKSRLGAEPTYGFACRFLTDGTHAPAKLEARELYENRGLHARRHPSGVRTESEPDLGAHVTAARPAPKSRCRCGRRGPVRVQQMWQGKPVGVGIPGYRELHWVFVCFVRLRMGSHWKPL